jgi:hypothetical protein
VRLRLMITNLVQLFEAFGIRVGRDRVSQEDQKFWKKAKEQFHPGHFILKPSKSVRTSFAFRAFFR